MRKALILLVILIAVGVVAWLVYPRLMANPAVQQATDITTTGKVKSAFALSKRLSPYDLAVTTQKGTVMLKGSVPTEFDKEMAGNVAKDTTGVSQVDNQIIIDPAVKPSGDSQRESARVTDLEIMADLRERISQSQALQGQQIKAEVQNRIVTLSGTVETPLQKNGAEQLARSISNIADVNNQLAITNPDAAKTEGTELSAAAQKDRELAQQVSFALFRQRDDFSDVGAIKIESNQGHVTLRGMVPSRAERALAELLTRQVPGVSEINNSLQVTTLVSSRQ